MSVLSIRGLGKRFGTVPALADLDLDIPEGSRTAVVGPSGSGKTTLLRLIAGFEAPDSGEIVADGQIIANPVMGVPPHRRNIGLVMQEGALFPHMSVMENIRFGIRHSVDGEAQALRLMELVELDRGMAVRQPHQLSGGQQQRVALARALARRPRLMLLDEPFSALDTGLREQLRRATANILAQEGVATVLVTHDRDEAMSFADQLVVLTEGRLAQAGAPRDIYLRPVDEAVAAFLGPAIIVDVEVRGEVAESILGAIPLRGERLPENSRARILLRPEQLSVNADGMGARTWLMQSIARIGGKAAVTVQHCEGQVISFETAQHDLPGVGAQVAVSVSGSAWALA